MLLLLLLLLSLLLLLLIMMMMMMISKCPGFMITTGGRNIICGQIITHAYGAGVFHNSRRGCAREAAVMV